MPARPALASNTPTQKAPPAASGRGRASRQATGPARFLAQVRRLRWTEFRLLIIPSLLSIVGMLMVILVPVGSVQWQWTDLWMSFLFIGLMYGTHAWLNVTRPRADQLLLPVVATIVVLGLVMIQRLEPSLSDAFRGIANKQVLWITAGVLALVVT